MNYDKELFYQEYVKREEDVLRAPYNPELEFYSHVKSGDMQWVKEATKEPLHLKKGLGRLSENPLRSLKYHFVVTAGLVARYCIDGGMSIDESYAISDLYINQADKCINPAELSSLHKTMCLEYTRRMRELRSSKICSKPIVDCINYIYANLHTRITAKQLADYVQLDPSYLSRLFKKETGSCLSEYINTRKLETACQMLQYSNYSPAKISATLAYPSQSYFTECFKNHTGMTPIKYRKAMLTHIDISKSDE